MPAETSRTRVVGRLLPAAFAILVSAAAVGAETVQTPEGFTALLDGQSLDGWWGAKTEDPRVYMALEPEELEKKKAATSNITLGF